MNHRRIAFAAMLLATGAAAAALAQSSPDLEPGVQTSPGTPTSPGTQNRPGPQAAPAPPPVQTPKPATAPPGDAATRPKPAGAAPQAASKPAPGATAQTADKSGARSLDRIQLDTTEISGNRELPKVMYVVPWRRADPGEFAGRPPNSLLDEALAPVDRDVFRRQNRYYSALEGAGAATSHSAAGGSPAAAPDTRDEK